MVFILGQKVVRGHARLGTYAIGAVYEPGGETCSETEVDFRLLSHQTLANDLLLTK
jgi:hypothetical protein